MNSDVPFVVSTRFRKVVQTAPYESEEAEVSSQFAVAEGVDAPDAISSAMSMVKRQVYIALGKAEGKLVAVSTQRLPDPSTVAGADVKKPVGRPRKDQGAEQVKPAGEVAASSEAPKPSPPAQTDTNDFDFSDDPAPKVDISDAELQGACSEAAKLIGAPKVKDLFQKKYGASRVSGVNKNERQNFLDDLKSLVEEHKKQSE